MYQTAKSNCIPFFYSHGLNVFYSCFGIYLAVLYFWNKGYRNIIVCVGNCRMNSVDTVYGKSPPYPAMRICLFSIIIIIKGVSRNTQLFWPIVFHIPLMPFFLSFTGHSYLQDLQKRGLISCTPSLAYEDRWECISTYGSSLRDTQVPPRVGLRARFRVRDRVVPCWQRCLESSIEGKKHHWAYTPC